MYLTFCGTLKVFNFLFVFTLFSEKFASGIFLIKNILLQTLHFPLRFRNSLKKNITYNSNMTVIAKTVETEYFPSL